MVFVVYRKVLDQVFRGAAALAPSETEALRYFL